MNEAPSEPILIVLESCLGQERQIQSLECHAYALSEIMAHPEIAKGDSAAWLRIASGVTSVSVNLLRFDESVMMCGRAAEYWEAQSDVAERYLAELTRFLFVWGALEAYIPEPGGQKYTPKVPKIQKRLAAFDRLFPWPAHMACAVHQFAFGVSRSEHLSYIRAHLSDDFERSASRIILAISKLRNGLAHGSLTFSDPCRWGGSPLVDISAICSASRLVLFSIQALLLQEYHGSDIVTDRPDYEGFSVDADLADVVRELHLVPIEYYFEKEWETR
jgi:hypothetical protein